jgi:hypothetical protein
LLFGVTGIECDAASLTELIRAIPADSTAQVVLVENRLVGILDTNVDIVFHQ